MRRIGILLLMIGAGFAGLTIQGFAADQTSPHGDLEENCNLCHSATGWVPAKFSEDWKHEKHGFALENSHETVPCLSCHVNLKFEVAGPACIDCHQDIHETEFGTDCSQCHTTVTFEDPAAFRRGHQSTRFPLTGAHLTAECAECHASVVGELQYIGTPTACEVCHVSDRDRAKDPDHNEAGLITNCESCHQTTAWAGADFDHSFFPLSEGHAGVDCASCHLEGQAYEEVSADCYACHQATFEATTAPDHIAANFPTDCAGCHTTSEWGDGAFDHDFFTLEQGHAGVDCASCHVGGDFSETPTTCEACHMADFEQSQEPVHTEAEFATDCASCHDLSGWENGIYDHSAFPLTQGHADANCSDCHVGGALFSTTSSDCYACHQATFEATTAPDHIAANFPTDCAECHTTSEWGDGAFDHDFFTLEQGHAGVDCASCHVGGDFSETPTTCEACHMADFEQSQEPVHAEAEFATDCASCHDLSGWENGIYDHSAFPLTQGHADANCSDCHVGGALFSTTSADCYACHQATFEATTAPDHIAANFPTDCAGCHTTSEWGDGAFDHDFFTLSQGHAGVDCASCHVGGDFSETPTTCEACHMADFDNSQEPIHADAEFATDCASCHDLSGWENGIYDHSFFALTQGHADANCSDCHVGGELFSTTSSDCYACHQLDYEGAGEPDHIVANFPTDCAECHTTSEWGDGTFDHDFFTLTQGHAGVDCASCHIDGVFAGTPTDCEACHMADFDNSQEPIHADAEFATDCASCHDLSGWENGIYDHSFFALTQGHADANCSDCHVGGALFSTTSADCYACHQATFEATTAPDHIAANFPTDCAECHTTSEWGDGTFDHDFFTLTQGHAGVDCASCHIDGVFAGTPTDCEACHMADFDNSQEPIHADAEFATDCASCHDLSGWENGIYDHSFFALTQGHADANCSDCHVGGELFSTTSSDCYACHQLDYEGAGEPDHIAANFPTDCAECHTTSEWGDGTFDHDFFTLTQGHAGVDCASCHIDGVFAGTPTDCEACHMADFDNSQEPIHADAEFATDCASCHDLSGWENGIYDHSFFALTQGHADANCSDCHVGGELFSTTSSDCYACHQLDYEGAGEPDHIAANFPTDCAECHTTSEWGDGVFDHDFFTLTQGHAGVDCASCHIDGVFAGTPTDCEACHMADFDNSQEPIHADAEFATDCASCHDLSGWENGIYDHSFFALTQGHADANCSDCHVGGALFSTTSADCYACHQTDYENAVPDHPGAGFPTDCTDCHNTTMWEGAVFDHDGTYFPIFTGKHRKGETWDDCTECHVSPGDFSTFSCIDCHKHSDENDVTDQHDGEQGFIYESFACYDCHPDGRK